MPSNCLLYYITDRTALAADESTRRHRLLEKIVEAAHAGVDYIQLREKDLSTRELESLAREVLHVVRETRKLATGHRPLTTALLINSRTDVSIAVGADGVHLRSEDISPQDVGKIWKGQYGADTPVRQLSPSYPLIGVSCHSPEEVAQAKANGASFTVFAPVFEKRIVQPAGLELLREACQKKIPVFALGGVTLENAQACFEAGAAGIAAIRLFQENDIEQLVRKLRNN
jgi:thiamine-phosphate pyrophosphorylase